MANKPLNGSGKSWITLRTYFAQLFQTERGKDMLIFTNAASTRRENLTVRLSYDGGQSWAAARVIDAGPAAYSTVISLQDGSVGVLYERGEADPYERITFARFDPAWVTGTLH